MGATSTVNTLSQKAADSVQAQRIQEALGALGDLAKLSIWLKTADGEMMPVFPLESSQRRSAEENSSLQSALARIPVEGGDEFLICGEVGDPTLLKSIEALVGATLHALGVEKREELLLDELGANWESLEALYEISTDILRSGDIKEALKRLVGRLASIQDGLLSALFVTRKGRFEPLVSTELNPKPVEAEQLGPVAKVMRDRQVITLNQLSERPHRQSPWRDATRIAAAPVTSGQKCIGFVVVWREDERFQFDSPFLRLLEAITYQASMLMESDRLNRKVRESELIAKEIEIASSIQQTLLLANAPRDIPEMEMAACSVPSQHIDGDFYDFFQHPDGTVDVIAGDVMGKGVAAALLGAATKNQLLRSIANLSLRSRTGAPQPAAIVRCAASRVEEQLIRLERFVTLCYARFDAPGKMVHFVDCGHTASILDRKSSNECIFLQGNDLPLGVLKNFECEQHSIAFLPGDTFLFYSDGVTENRSPEGEFFGAERLADCLQNWSSLGPALLVEQIRKEALRFNRAERFSDDFTCIAVKIRIAAAAQQPVSSSIELFPCDPTQLAQFRAWLCESALSADNPLGEEELAKMELACTELFVNCAFHAQQASVLTQIRVECHVYADHVTVRMHHRGPEFDPLSIPPPSFDGSRDSGFGTYIVLRSANEATYERGDDGTNVTTVSFLRTFTENIPCN